MTQLLKLEAKNGEPVFAPPPTAVLTKDQLMEWLQIGEKTYSQMDFPYIPFGHRTPRYMVAHILRYLDELAIRHSGKVWDHDATS